MSKAFASDEERAASCLAAIQRILREHRFRVDCSEWLDFISTPTPENSTDLFDGRVVGWRSGEVALPIETINILAQERLSDNSPPVKTMRS